MELKIKYKPSGGIFPPRLAITYTDITDQSSDIELDFSVTYDGEDNASQTWRITTRCVLLGSSKFQFKFEFNCDY